MYCTSCGNLLKEEDKFCSNCGQKVIQEENSYEEVIFSPPFKVEAEHITTKEPEEKIVSAPKTEVANFSWNLEGFPEDKPKKTEDIDFNWRSVIEEKRRNENKDIDRNIGFIKTPTTKPEEFFSKEKEEEIVEMGLPQEEELNQGSLEEELFKEISNGDILENTDKIDKFYTFNKKNEEFQQLLDLEYNKLKGENQETPVEVDFEEPENKDINIEKLNIDKTIEVSKSLIDFELEDKIDADLLAKFKLEEQEELEAKEPPTFEEAFKQVTEEKVGELPPISQPTQGIEQQENQTSGERTPVRGSISEEVTEPEEIGEKDVKWAPQEIEDNGTTEVTPRESEESDRPSETATASQSEKKLTFDDVFPFSDNDGKDDDDFDKEEPEKKSKASTVIITILIVILLFVLGIIGIKIFAPESAVSATIDKAYFSVMSIFTGDESKEGNTGGNTNEPTTTIISNLIETQKHRNTNIGSIVENIDLKFGEKQNQAFPQLEDAYDFSDNMWYTNENDDAISYGEEIVGTVIEYFSKWVDEVNGKDTNILDFVKPDTRLSSEVAEIQSTKDVTYGINKLEIGEVKTGENGFFVMATVTKIDSEKNKEVVIKQIIYMEPIEKAMKIAEIKEF